MSVRHGILAVLDRRSMHGYELRRELGDELGPEWDINFGQIYTTLERLVRDGLVVQSETLAPKDAPERKLYTVTPAGRAELHRWFLSPAEGPATGRDDLFAKVALAMTGDVDVEDVIQAQRKGQLRRIALLTELKESYDAQLDLASILQTDLSIAKTEAVIRWLDTAEARIRKAAKSAAGGVGGGRARPTRASRKEAVNGAAVREGESQ